MWEIEKTTSRNRVVRLKRTIFELEWSLAQKGGLTLNQESAKYDRD
jgi:hypothetical protein